MAEKEDEFSVYFKSDLHNSRMLDAQKRTGDRLSALVRHDMLFAFSEAIGTIFGVGHFYRTMGLKHQGAKVLMGVFHWMKSGTD